MSLVHLRIKPRQICQHLQIGNHTKPLSTFFLYNSLCMGPCAIVPFTWKMAHVSLFRMVKKGLKKSRKWPVGKNLFQNTARRWLPVRTYHTCLYDYHPSYSWSRSSGDLITWHKFLGTILGIYLHFLRKIRFFKLCPELIRIYEISICEVLHCPYIPTPISSRNFW